MGMLISGKWVEDEATQNKQGKFVRPDSIFRNWVTSDGSAGPSGHDGFKAEPNRYHLYVSHNCPWAYRTMVLRKLKGLEKFVSVAISASSVKDEGWTYIKEPGCVPDAVNNITYLHEVYTKAEPQYTGRVTVPTLWDRARETIVSNESSEIIRMFNSAFNEVGATSQNYYPDDLRNEIDNINDVIYKNVNNGVYRCGFASTQAAYEEAFDNLFNTLEELEKRLNSDRYLVGGTLTEADWRLFSTLLRFDIVYYGLFKCNKRHIYEYPNLWNFTLELYQYPGIEDVTDLDHIKRGYYANMQRLDVKGFVPKGPNLKFTDQHDRDRLPKN